MGLPPPRRGLFKVVPRLHQGRGIGRRGTEGRTVDGDLAEREPGPDSHDDRAALHLAGAAGAADAGHRRRGRSGLILTNPCTGQDRRGTVLYRTVGPVRLAAGTAAPVE